MANTIIYLIVAGVAAWWLFMAGGLQQIQGMLGGLGGGGGGSPSPVNDPQGFAESVKNKALGGINTGSSSLFQKSNINGNISINRKVNTLPGSGNINQSHSIVQVDGKTISESNRVRMSYN